jgi:hypothetical protein
MHVQKKLTRLGGWSMAKRRHAEQQGKVTPRSHWEFIRNLFVMRV